MLRALFIALMLATPASARTVTDHAGFVVEVPDTPLRIVSLSDWTVTVMAHELGLPLAGSVGRADAQGYHIRGARELFGMEFCTVELASVHGALDAERIAALKPDLIVGLQSDTISQRELLSSIAPVLLFDTENGRDMLENYADFADWTGKRAEFDALRATYDARVRAMARRTGSYLVIRPSPRDGTMTLYRHFGAVTVAMDDLGYIRLPIADTMPQDAQRAVFSPEVLAEMDADILIAGHMEDRGETAATSLSDFDTVAFGASETFRAVRDGRFISFSRFHVASPAFAALHLVLDRLEEAP